MNDRNEPRQPTTITYVEVSSPDSLVTVPVRPPEVATKVSGRLKASGIQQHGAQYMVISTEQGEVALHTQVVLPTDPPSFVEGRGVKLVNRHGKVSAGWEILASPHSLAEAQTVPQQHIERYTTRADTLLKVVRSNVREAREAADYLDRDMGWSSTEPPPAPESIPIQPEDLLSRLQQVETKVLQQECIFAELELLQLEESWDYLLEAAEEQGLESPLDLKGEDGKLAAQLQQRLNIPPERRYRISTACDAALQLDESPDMRSILEEKLRQCWAEKRADLQALHVLAAARQKLDGIVTEGRALMEDLRVLGDRPVPVQQSMIEHMREFPFPCPVSKQEFKTQVEAARFLRPHQLTSIEFESVCWPGCSEVASSNPAPKRFTAEIASSKRGSEFKGTFLACGVRQGGAEYVMLDTTDEDADETHVYRAFRSNLKIDPAAWQGRGWDKPPHLMCRAAVLESYETKPFWGWEFHRPTPGEGWYLMEKQNVERRIAPANEWVNEIERDLLPKMKLRLHHAPKVHERCVRIYSAQFGRLDHDEPIVRANGPIEVTHGALVRDNLVGTVADYWRSDELSSRSLTEGIDHLDEEIPRLERRVVQGHWLLDKLRRLGTRPIEMQRTMVWAERKFSLPIPINPLSLEVKNTVAPAARIKIR